MIPTKKTTAKQIAVPKQVTAPAKKLLVSQPSAKRLSIQSGAKKTLINAFNTKSAAHLKEPTPSFRKSYAGPR